MRSKASIFATAGAIGLGIAAPAAAQDAGEPGITTEIPTETVFDDDYLTIGIGLGLVPSYSGSDDYVLFPLPLIQASYAGIDINPRPAGLALDFIPDPETGPRLSGGVVVTLNRDRVDNIEDEIVASYGELDTAVEVGPTAGISVPALLNPYDSLTFNVDAAWDVAGAHNGRNISPSITYFTPLSRGMAASLSFSASHIDDDYADYYYSVPQINTLLPDADVLPGFQASGGFERIGANVLVAFDLNGDITDGGFSIVGIGGYSSLLNDAKRSPFTSIRGDADQWLGAVGIGYTF